MRKIPKAALTVTFTLLAAPHPNQAQEPRRSSFADTHCAADSVRSRNAGWAGNLTDESTFEGLFALASLERECRGAVAAAENYGHASAPRENASDHPWTAFCDAPRSRHRNIDPNNGLWVLLRLECRAAIQAVANEEQEVTRCHYTSSTVCAPGGDCTTRRNQGNSWLEIPATYRQQPIWWHSAYAAIGEGPYPTIRICTGTGRCSRIEILDSSTVESESWPNEGRTHVLRQVRGSWLMKIDTGNGQFVQLDTWGLNTLINSGTCPEALTPTTTETR